MNRTLLSTILLASASAQAGDLVGVVQGTNIALVIPTSATLVAQCTPQYLNTCWPSTPSSMGPAVPLGNLPATARVWAQIGTANPGWTNASALSADIAAPVTTPPSAVLTWTAPTANSDGSAISLSLTYNLYSGPSATAMSTTPMATGLVALTDTLTGLTPGSTACYSITAVEAGNESPQSNIVCKTFSTNIPGPVVLTIK